MFRFPSCSCRMTSRPIQRSKWTTISSTSKVLFYLHHFLKYYLRSSASHNLCRIPAGRTCPAISSSRSTALWCFETSERGLALMTRTSWYVKPCNITATSQSLLVLDKCSFSHNSASSFTGDTVPLNVFNKHKHLVQQAHCNTI